jgi:hypothetical protein
MTPIDTLFIGLGAGLMLGYSFGFFLARHIYR